MSLGIFQVPHGTVVEQLAVFMAAVAQLLIFGGQLQRGLEGDREADVGGDLLVLAEPLVLDFFLFIDEVDLLADDIISIENERPVNLKIELHLAWILQHSL